MNTVNCSSTGIAYYYVSASRTPTKTCRRHTIPSSTISSSLSFKVPASLLSCFLLYYLLIRQRTFHPPPCLQCLLPPCPWQTLPGKLCPGYTVAATGPSCMVGNPKGFVRQDLTFLCIVLSILLPLSLFLTTPYSHFPTH